MLRSNLTAFDAALPLTDAALYADCRLRVTSGADTKGLLCPMMVQARAPEMLSTRLTDLPEEAFTRSTFALGLIQAPSREHAAWDKKHSVTFTDPIYVMIYECEEKLEQPKFDEYIQPDGFGRSIMFVRSDYFMNWCHCIAVNVM